MQWVLLAEALFIVYFFIAKKMVRAYHVAGKDPTKLPIFLDINYDLYDFTVSFVTIAVLGTLLVSNSRLQ